MNNLRLIPDIRHRQPIIKAVFAYDRELIALVKAQKGARWSQTLRSWYFPQKDFKLHVFCQAMKSNAFVDYQHLKKAGISVNIQPICYVIALLLICWIMVPISALYSNY